MSQTIDLKVDYTNRLAQENEALKAQLEQFREFAELIVEWKEYGFEKAKTLLDSTPAQSLAEIKARAVEDALRMVYHEEDDHRGYYSYQALAAYANQLRQQAEGE